LRVVSFGVADVGGLVAMESLVTVEVGELKVGMYVIMPTSWGGHPFLKNEFILSSKKQVEKIIQYGIKNVRVNVRKSLIPVAPTVIPSEDGNASEEAPAPDTQDAIFDELYDVIHDSSISAKDRSRLVRKNSLHMMDNLLQAPSAENIRKSKKAIAEIVELILNDDQAAEGLITITDHDYYTYTHSVNVGLWAISLAKELFRHSYAHDLHELGAGFFLHDIGKVRVDPQIINNPGRLSEKEMTEMRKHPFHGYRILDETHQLTEECKSIVLQHHERQNGAGYPKGLQGDSIHIYAKICSIADVYDALTSDRSYRKGSMPFEALKIMKTQMIDHFQGDIFEKFVRMLL
jgi:HD-GYP domain-containing protein (c-di-GMP phosphodiesterase class II)